MTVCCAPFAGRDGTTPNAVCKDVLGEISIPAPLAGRDHHDKEDTYDTRHFNPRAPRGARPPSAVVAAGGGGFQSTRPLRGATSHADYRGHLHRISIHAPLAGRDEHGHKLPHRRAISIHAPLAGRDLLDRYREQLFAQFQSTRPLRGATANLTKNACQICAKGTKFTRQTHQRHGTSERPLRSAAPERLNRRCEPPDTFLIA